MDIKYSLRKNVKENSFTIWFYLVLVKPKNSKIIERVIPFILSVNTISLNLLKRYLHLGLSPTFGMSYNCFSQNFAFNVKSTCLFRVFLFHQWFWNQTLYYIHRFQMQRHYHSKNCFFISPVLGLNCQLTMTASFNYRR